MPVDVKDITEKAEVSHSTVSRALNNHLVIAHETVERIQRFTREKRHVTSHEVQGGLENVTHLLIIGNSFFTPVYLNKSGIYVSTVFIHHHSIEVLSDSIYSDDVNALSVEATFT